MQKKDNELFIGIDIGTTLCKCVIIDKDLAVHGSASRRMQISVQSGGVVEQDAEEWWDACCATISEVLKLSDVKAENVRTIGISSQGISFVPVDKNCTPLRPAFSWMDMRASLQTERIRSIIDEKDLFSITGKRCNAAYTLPKLLWFKENEAEIYYKTFKILMPLDFLIARFSGEFVTDHTMASGTMLYDIKAGVWSNFLLEKFDLKKELLPKLQWSGEPVGTIRKEVADKLGLPASIIIGVGGQDQKIAAFGAGINKSRATISLGTAMAILRQNEEPMLDSFMRIPCFAGLAKGSWIIEGSSDCCNILDWMKATFSPNLDYSGINKLVETIDQENNSILILPFFSGAGSPFNIQEARGMFSGLDFSVSLAHLFKGFYESIALLIRYNLEVMQEISGSFDELRIFGGGAKSNVWCQIIADANDKPVSKLVTSEAASIGAAILGGQSCGYFIDTALENRRPAEKYEENAIKDKEKRKYYNDFINIGTIFQPKEKYKIYYEKKYREFHNMVERTLF